MAHAMTMPEDELSAYRGMGAQSSHSDMSIGHEAAPEFDGTNMARPQGTAHISTLPGAELLDSYILGATAKQRLNEDQKLFKEMERRRKLEMVRRTRLFDAKCRAIGVDKEALDAQVLEKQQKRREELLHTRKEDLAFISTGKILQMAELEKVRDKRTAEKTCKEFSLEHLSAEKRREFDINDPNIKKNTLPARVGDDDLRCGPASMQRFGGEDLMGPERIRQQKIAMTATIEQQKYEKAMIAYANNPDFNGEAAAAAEVCALATEMEKQNDALRSEMAKNQQRANVQQAMEGIARKQSLTELEQMQNQRELDFHATDQFLNETTPYHHGERIRRDMFKGSNREKRIQAAQGLIDQANQQFVNRQGEHHEQRMFEQETEKTRRLVMQAEREKSRTRRQAAMAMAAENQQLALEQKAANMERAQLYTNKFSDEYWDKWTNQIR